MLFVVSVELFYGLSSHDLTLLHAQRSIVHWLNAAQNFSWQSPESGAAPPRVLGPSIMALIEHHAGTHLPSIRVNHAKFERSLMAWLHLSATPNDFNFGWKTLESPITLPICRAM